MLRSLARIYSNENFPFLVVKELISLGYDILTVHDTGKANKSISDDEVLSFAIAQNRILLTLNRKHFIRLHFLYPNHSGIIVCSFDLDFYGQSRRIHSVIESSESLTGKLIRIDRIIK